MSSVVGQSLFFMIDRNGTFVGWTVEKERLSSSDFKDMASVVFVECRNFEKMQRFCRCHAAAVKVKGHAEWSLVCIHELNFESLTYYQWIGPSTKNANGDMVPSFLASLYCNSHSSKPNIMEHFKGQKKSIHEIDDIRYLNQVMGPGFKPSNCINPVDKKLQCSSEGPCLLIPVAKYWQKEAMQEFPPGAACKRSIGRSSFGLGPSFVKSPGKGTKRRKCKCGVSCQANGCYSCNSVLSLDVNPSFDHLQQATLYVQDSPLRLCAGNEKTLAIPYITQPGKFRFICYKQYNKVKRALNGLDIDQYESELDKTDGYSLQYFMLDERVYTSGLRICLVPNSTEFAPDKPFPQLWSQCGPIDATTDGVVIGRWLRDSSLHCMELDSFLCNILEDSLGEGYGNRSHSICIGRYANIGKRTSGRPGQSPVCGPKAAIDHCYYRQHHDPLFQPLINKVVNRLIQAAVTFGCRSFPTEHSVLYGGLDRSVLLRAGAIKLLTQGLRGQSHGFGNTCHVDRRDQVSKKDQDNIRALVGTEEDEEDVPLRIREKKKHICNFASLYGLSAPTTCIYQFVLGSTMPSSVDIIQYFLYDGFHAAIRFGSHVGHSFFGNLFSHRTAVCVVVLNGKVYLSFDDWAVNVFAWGNGKTQEQRDIEARAAAVQRAREERDERAHRYAERRAAAL